jgi:hypothetical protein
LFPYSTEEGGNRNYMVCTNEAGLLLMASLGSLKYIPGAAVYKNLIILIGVS